MQTPNLPGQFVATIVDLSNVQRNADLLAAKNSGVVAVILKATEGMDFKDKGFRRLHEAAINAGLKVGAYHFGTAKPVDAQVANFVTTIRETHGNLEDILTVLDLEHNDPSPANTMSPAHGLAWVEEFRRQVGRNPVLYTGNHVRDVGGATGPLAGLASCPLWLAQYSRQPKTIAGWDTWSLWQFTDGTQGPYPGEVPGIGRCDQNVFNGSRADFDDFWAGYSTSEGPK